MIAADTALIQYKQTGKNANPLPARLFRKGEGESRLLNSEERFPEPEFFYSWD
jgi:hypothetical protein